jgi:TonB family protein
VIPQTDGNAPVPTNPLDVPDDNYPFDSLLSNEEGGVTLRLVLDGSGHSTEIRLVKSSGFSQLDQRAAQIARARWKFQPGADVAVVTVNWKLPYQTVDDYVVKTPPPPSNAVALKAIANHAVRVGDYPSLSVRAGETGIVGLRYSVKADGNIGSVEIAQSSGIKRLDDAAASMIVKRWAFEARTSGDSSLWWKSVTVAFHIVPGGGLRCYPAPVAADEEVWISGVLNTRGVKPVSRFVDRWAFVTEKGEISDVLLRTNKGLVRPNEALAKTIGGTAYPKPSGGRGCWYYSPIAITN